MIIEKNKMQNNTHIMFKQINKRGIYTLKAILHGATCFMGSDAEKF